MMYKESENVTVIKWKKIADRIRATGNQDMGVSRKKFKRTIISILNNYEKKNKKK